MHELDIRKVPRHPSEENSDFVDHKASLTETESVNFILPGNITEPHYFQPSLFDAKPHAQHPSEEKERKRFRPTFKKAVLLPFTVIVLVFGVFLGMRFVNFARSISTTPESTIKTISTNIGAAFGAAVPALKSLDNTPLAQAIEQKKTINILLLGYGGEGHQAAYLTDSIMVASINFDANKVSLISIPRDTWTQIPTNGYDGSYAKINAAYAFGVDQSHYPNKLPQFTGEKGGGNLSKYVVSKIVGLPIDYYLAVDFDGFKKMVDDVGGVTVSVDNTFTDYTYPSSDANINGPSCAAEDDTDTTCRYKVVHFDSGEQFMDGDRALEYARSRHAAGVEGSDFSRSKRQQKVIVAVEQKALQLNMLPRIFNLMDDVSGHFQTDLTLAEIQTLASYVNDGKIDLKNANHISLTDSGSLLVSGRSDDGQWILQPVAGLNNWSKIQEYIKARLTVQNAQMYGPFKE